METILDTIQLDKPLTEQDLENLKQIAKKDILESYWIYRKLGAIVISVSIAWHFFAKYIINSDNPSANSFFFMLFLVGLALGICIILMPQLLGFANFERLFYFKYEAASSLKIHNCKAYLNMPGMEAHKEYFEKVQFQGRTLTNQEVEFITNYWESLNKE
jgi:hypothetical protein